MAEEGAGGGRRGGARRGAPAAGPRLDHAAVVGRDEGVARHHRVLGEDRPRPRRAEHAEREEDRQDGAEDRRPAEDAALAPRPHHRLEDGEHLLRREEAAAVLVGALELLVEPRLLLRQLAVAVDVGVERLERDRVPVPRRRRRRVLLFREKPGERGGALALEPLLLKARLLGLERRDQRAPIVEPVGADGLGRKFRRRWRRRLRRGDCRRLFQPGGHFDGGRHCAGPAGAAFAQNRSESARPRPTQRPTQQMFRPIPTTSGRSAEFYSCAPRKRRRSVVCCCSPAPLLLPAPFSSSNSFSLHTLPHRLKHPRVWVAVSAAVLRRAIFCVVGANLSSKRDRRPKRRKWRSSTSPRR